TSVGSVSKSVWQLCPAPGRSVLRSRQSQLSNLFRTLVPAFPLTAENVVAYVPVINPQAEQAVMIQARPHNLSSSVQTVQTIHPGGSDMRARYQPIWALYPPVSDRKVSTEKTSCHCSGLHRGFSFGDSLMVTGLKGVIERDFARTCSISCSCSF